MSNFPKVPWAFLADGDDGHIDQFAGQHASLHVSELNDQAGLVN